MDVGQRFDVQSYVQRQLYLHQNDYMEYDNADVQLITLNINEKKSCERIAGLIKPYKALVAIVLQEVDMSLNALMSPQSQKLPSVIKVFYELHQFAHVEYQQFGSMVLLLLFNSDVQVSFRPGISCGYMNKFGNKGMICARVQLHQTRLLFIGGHLSADRSENGCFRRNSNLVQIFKQMQPWERWPHASNIEIFDDFLQNGEVTGNYSVSLRQSGVPAFVDVDYVYLFGDLNYRMNNVENIEEFVGTLLRAEGGGFEDVLQNDQLFAQMQYLQQYTAPIPFDSQIALVTTAQRGSMCAEPSENDAEGSNSATTQVTVEEQFLEKQTIKPAEFNTKTVFALGALQMFREDRIAFLPTYKISQTGDFNTNRVPSYCDRILYYLNKFSTVLASRYYCARNVLVGDHFPVILEQTIAVAHPNQQRLEACRKRILDDANQIQNYLVPKFRICNPYLTFSCAYGQFASLPFVVENTHKQSRIGLRLDAASAPKYIIFDLCEITLPPLAKATLNAGCLINYYAAGADVVAAATRGETFEVTIPVHATYNGEIQNVQYLNISVTPQSDFWASRAPLTRLREGLPRVAAYVFDLVGLCAKQQTNPERCKTTFSEGELYGVLEIWRDSGYYESEIVPSDVKMLTVVNLLAAVAMPPVVVPSEANIHDQYYCDCCLYQVLAATHARDELLPLLLGRVVKAFQQATIKQQTSFAGYAELTRRISDGSQIPLHVNPRAVLEYLFDCAYLLREPSGSWEPLSQREQQTYALVMAACINHYASGLPNGNTFRDVVFRFWDREVFGADAQVFQKLQ